MIIVTTLCPTIPSITYHLCIPIVRHIHHYQDFVAAVLYYYRERGLSIMFEFHASVSRQQLYPPSLHECWSMDPPFVLHLQSLDGSTTPLLT